MKISHIIPKFLASLVAGLALIGCFNPEPDVDDECINPETGEPGVVFNCFANPCSVSSCEGDPEATCEANYCGG